LTSSEAGGLVSGSASISSLVTELSPPLQEFCAEQDTANCQGGRDAKPEQWRWCCVIPTALIIIILTLAIAVLRDGRQCAQAQQKR
jgi:hypothetical protein